MTPEESTIALTRSRAIHELRLQQGLRITEGSRTLGYALPAEFIEGAEWQKLRALKPQLLLSTARAIVLKIPPVQGVIACDAGHLSLAELWQKIAGAEPMRSEERPVTPPAFGQALIHLAKQAGIIPALLWIVGPVEHFPALQTLDIRALMHEPPVELLRGETVKLPIEGAENATLTSFRARYGSEVHLALTLGDTQKKPPLVRVHSSCVTGDLLGSLRCDCGDQLRLALAHMKEAACGILLYLYQEGRGIGITSKLRAYALQEQGLDTFVANQQLGFEEDERDFSIAAAILRTMGHENIRLLTNNPDKIEAFVESDIRVTERLPLVVDPTSHNHAYLESKRAKHGQF